MEELNGEITVSIDIDESATQVYSVGAIPEASITVFDDDAPSNITITGDSDLEGNQESDNKTLTFDVTLSSAAMNDITVTYQVMNGSAIVTDDFVDITTPTPGTLIFVAGETTKTITIALVEDEIYEGEESFTIMLSSATQGATIMDVTLPRPGQFKKMIQHQYYQSLILMIRLRCQNMLDKLLLLQN